MTREPWFSALARRVILRLFGWWTFDGYRLDFAASRFTLRSELWYRRRNLVRRLRRSTKREGFPARKRSKAANSHPQAQSDG